MFRFQAIVVVLLAVVGLSPAGAGVVHKWIDEHGVTHYSDEAPPQTETTRIEVPDADPAAGGDDYYSIANQWQRLHRERLELERVRGQQAAATQPAPTVIVIENDDDEKYAVVFQRRHHQRHKVRPRHAPPRRDDIPRNWLAQRQRGGLYIPRLKPVSY